MTSRLLRWAAAISNWIAAPAISNWIAAPAISNWIAAPRVAAWLLVPALGFALRMAPPSGNTWTLDAAEHYRLAAERIERGRLPDPDPLTDLPLGRHLGRYLPLGLYEVASAWHRVAAPIWGGDLAGSLTRLTALAGALIAWPVWIGARAAGAGPWSAALAAFLAVFAPAHVEQTTAYLLRYDVLGTLLATTCLALGLAALAARTAPRAWGLAALSGFALIAALAVWRMPLLVPVLVAITAAGLAIARPPSTGLRGWTTTLALSLIAACLGLEYLRAQQHLLAVSTLGVIAVAAALHAPAVRRPESRVATRAAIVIGSILAAVVIGMTLGRGGDYETLGRLLRLRALLTFGIVGPADPMTGVLLTVRELQPLPLAALWGPSLFSWLSLWLIISPACLWLASGKTFRSWLAGVDAPAVMLIGVTLGLTLLTLLANRHRVLLAPPVAVLASVSAAAFARAAARGATGETPARARWIGWAGLIAIAPCALMCLRSSTHSATRFVTHVSPEWAATRRYAHEHAAGRPVLSFWERGYELQLEGCATYADGLLESPVNQRHIVTAARALMMRTPDSLAALCRRFDIRYVIVPPSWSLYGVAMAAQDPMVETVVAHQPLTAEQADRVVIRMMLNGRSEPPFEPVFEQGGYRIYRLADSPAATGARR